MQIDQTHYRTIWVKPDDERTIQIIDQRFLPHQFVVNDLQSVDDVARAIKDMQVRGAPLIGVCAAFGMYFSCLEAPDEIDACKAFIELSAQKLIETRPTAVNLKWAINEQFKALEGCSSRKEKINVAFDLALKIAEDDVKCCAAIGTHGVDILRKIHEQKGVVNILTHCNAGWLACVDWGTATSPIYHAFNEGLNVHVWVDETRPRNQGAMLTAWELGKHGVPHTLIVDNAGGHLMQQGLVDVVIVGSDRTTAGGDVANKIGTYLKALAANDNDIPFYVALPSTTIDWNIESGKDIPIEERDGEEVSHISGWCEERIQKVRISPETSEVSNFGFDVTPNRLVTGLITERGICEANKAGLAKMFPEFAGQKAADGSQ